MAGSTSNRAPRVLIVEDDYLVASQAESALSEAGCDVIGIAGSVTEALDLAKDTRPDIVIMDIRLRGGQDGIDGAARLLTLHGSRCIFATAHHDAETRRRAEATAPLGWLPKPYSANALVSLTKRALGELGAR